MSHSFLSSRGARLVAAGVVGAAVLLGPGTAAHADTSSDPVVASEVEDGAAADVAPEAEQPPLRSATLSDGTVIEAVDPAAVEALTAAAAANRNCNSDCDGTSPDYQWTPPGGQSNWYRCSDDAITVYAVKERAPLTGNRLELRYSPQCRSAWARGWAYHNFFVESFNGSTSRKIAWHNHPGSGPQPTNRTWTAMVNDKGYTARACGGVGPDTPRSEFDCTKKY
ncbi:DUF2690 domain-containing protein [Actinoplanes sp. NPDC049668]|uniref:DUF2690 domain-containing protein n=1 Tax=unclassified Actinoplanes TaxID=2626549 RepID=UPI0033B3E775